MTARESNQDYPQEKISEILKAMTTHSAAELQALLRTAGADLGDRRLPARPLAPQRRMDIAQFIELDQGTPPDTQTVEVDSGKQAEEFWRALERIARKLGIEEELSALFSKPSPAGQVEAEGR